MGRDATHDGGFSAVVTPCQRRDKPSARRSPARYAAQSFTIPLHPARGAARVQPAPPATSHYGSISDGSNRGTGGSSADADHP